MPGATPPTQRTDDQAATISVDRLPTSTAVDGYMLEFLQGDPTFIAVAFGVTDIDKTTKFYTDAFGLESTGSP